MSNIHNIIELNKIYNMDCIEGMKLIEDKSIDLILCDLPYGQTNHAWDCKIDLAKLWKQYERIIKDNGIIALTAKGQFMVDLILSKRNMYRYEWIWDKNKGANFAHVKKRPLNVHEYVLIYYKNEGTYNPQMTDGKPYTQKRAPTKVRGVTTNMKRLTTTSDGKRYPKSIIKVEGMAQRNIVHPTQKPVTLFEFIIKTYTNEGDIVLDNCMGSGTTALACKLNNRNYIGFETEPDYVDIANERLSHV